MTITVLKIILWILLALLLVIVLLCLLNVKITIYNREKFGYKITVGGIRIKPEKFFRMKSKHQETEKSPKKEQPKAVSPKKEPETQKKKKSLSETFSIISDVATTAKDTLPKGVRIRLKYLNITVGGSDAAETAVSYGKITALLHGVLALFDAYKGFIYGFRVKRNRIIINADFLSQKTEAEFELTISFFIWQLLFSGIRIGIATIKAIIDNDRADT